MLVDCCESSWASFRKKPSRRRRKSNPKARLNESFSASGSVKGWAMLVVCIMARPGSVSGEEDERGDVGLVLLSDFSTKNRRSGNDPMPSFCRLRKRASGNFVALVREGVANSFWDPQSAARETKRPIVSASFATSSAPSSLVEVLVTPAMGAAAFEANVFPATVWILATHAQVVEFAYILWVPRLLRRLPLCIRYILLLGQRCSPKSSLFRLLLAAA